MESQSRNVFLDYIQKVGLAEVLDDLDDVGMVELLQDLYLLETCQQVYIPSSTQDLADTLYPACSIEHLAHCGSSAPDYFREVIDGMWVSSLPIYYCLCLQFDILFIGKTLVAIEGRICLH